MARILQVAAYFLFLTKLSLGQRKVAIQKGPLYRVEGQATSIACNVTRYQGPSKQHFRWSFYLSTAPTREIQIISTDDVNFPFALYAQRVQSGDIYVERVQDNAVLLHFSKLLKSDSGEYECHTPSTDSKYFGIYSAKADLFVIPDTLSATMTPKTFSKEEGESLELTCEAAKATVKHTHLSVTWYLVQNGQGNQATEVISLSKDFLFVPGPLYSKRFAADDVRLDGFGATTYRLSISRLQPSDQGELFCEAGEWIQDPDGTWTLITKKHTDRTTLWVHRAAKDLQVNITAKSTVTMGSFLELVCLVVGGVPDLQLQGVWFFNNTEVAGIDADGVLGVESIYEEKASQGQFQFSKLSPKTFSFKILAVGPENEGTYRCVVAEVERARLGSWNVLQRRQSPDHHMHLKIPEVRNVVLSITNTEPFVWQGEALGLLCEADGTESNTLSVSWWHFPQGQTRPEFVAGMDQHGVMRLGTSYGTPRNRGNTRVEKMGWGTFQLEIPFSTLDDNGTYECRVSEKTWKQATELSWTLQLPVTVKSLESSLLVNLLSEPPRVTLTSTFKLKCTVQANYSGLSLPLTVTWHFQPAKSRVFHRLLRITHDGTIEWGTAPFQFSKKTKVTKSSFYSQLMIHDATEAESGMYQCEVEVYARSALLSNNPTKASATSHSVKIVVTLPDSKLKVNSSSQGQELSVNSNTKISCSVLSQSPGNLQLVVIWYYSSLTNSASWQQILEVNQTNVVKYGDDFHTPEGKRKFHTRKVSQDVFELQILNVADSDQGSYLCCVQEWLLSTNGAWYKLGEETSGLTVVKVKSTGSKVSVSKVYGTENVTEHGEMAIYCSMELSGSPASLYSVTWYRNREDSGSKMVVHLQHDGLLKFGEEGLGRHLLCYRSSTTDFVLKFPRVEVKDAGMYWCRVAEWHFYSDPGTWISQGSDESRRMALTVLPSEPTFLSKICSSAPLFYLLLLCPIVTFLLLISTLCLYWNAKKLPSLTESTQKDEALWVDTQESRDRPRHSKKGAEEGS